MRTFAATAAVVLALTGCSAPPSGPPPTAEPLDPVDAIASTTPPPEEPSPELSTPSETPEEVPTSADELPDIWVEISALYARKPAETRDQTCAIIHDDLTADATVLLWQIEYEAATGEEAEAEEVRTVLLWLCESNTQ